LKHYHYKYYGDSASIHDTTPVHTVKNLQQQLSRSPVSTYKSIRKKIPSLQINDKPLQPRKKGKKKCRSSFLSSCVFKLQSLQLPIRQQCKMEGV
jgi:hypothetical protein